MAINFLIALATALGSATLILLVLRFLVKVFAPDALKEMIASPAKTTERRASEATRTPAQVIVDEATLVALSGKNIVDLFGDKQPRQFHIYIPHTYPTTEPSMQVVSMLNTRSQGTRGFKFVAAKIPEVGKEKEGEKYAWSFEELLSPPGQSTPNFGTANKSLGAPDEAICGSAS